MGPSSAANAHMLSRGPHRPFLLVLLVAWALVMARSLVFIAFEQSFFDSDQAIVGLMAKHLVEGRAFPLFYYGQTYMLGVDAWVAAPVFWVFGPTVGALHGALTIINLAVVTALLIGLVRGAQVSPWLALLATAFFTMAPPVTARYLVEAGANIGPLLYVPALWFLRRRPLWWGLVMAIGFLHREFTVYAVPALIAADVLSARGRVTGDLLSRWIAAFVVALGCWQGIQALAPYADFGGPGTRGQLLDGYGGSQGGNIAERISLVPAEWPSRARVMVSAHLPRLFGMARVEDVAGAQGRTWLVLPIAGFLALAFVRAAWRSWGTWREGTAAAPFAWYLAAVGATAIAAYVATRPAGALVDRYLLLALLFPVGVCGAFFAVERVAWIRIAGACLLGVWVASAGVDHLRQWQRFAADRAPDPLRVLIAGLEARGITVAEADYWRAYKLSFLARERVVVASTDFVRIASYQTAAREAGPRLVRLSETPCAGGEQVSLWYLCGER